MTIHWKGHEQHFPIVPLFFSIQPFMGKISFSEFFTKKPQSLLTPWVPRDYICSQCLRFSDFYPFSTEKLK
jgi:hypothetical protein